MKNIKNIKIITSETTKSNKIKKDLELILNRNGFQINNENYDLAIAIGGDGTFIKMVRELNFNSDVYYVGINTGTLGFLQNINPEDINEFVLKLKNNDFKIEEIGVQQNEIITEKDTYNCYSLNEIVIRDYKFKTTYLNVKVDGNLLEKFTGDGILISTTVGSTAYNASLGGAIVAGGIHTVQITPIAPLINRVYKSLNNSVLLPENKTITVEPSYLKDNDLLVIVDGTPEVYKDVMYVSTTVKDKRIKCLRMNDFDYTTKINEKFLK